MRIRQVSSQKWKSTLTNLSATARQRRLADLKAWQDNWMIVKQSLSRRYKEKYAALGEDYTTKPDFLEEKALLVAEMEAEGIKLGWYEEVTPEVEQAEMEQDLIDKLNEIRKKRGLPELDPATAKSKLWG